MLAWGILYLSQHKTEKKEPCVQMLWIWICCPSKIKCSTLRNLVKSFSVANINYLRCAAQIIKCLRLSQFLLTTRSIHGRCLLHRRIQSIEQKYQLWGLSHRQAMFFVSIIARIRPTNPSTTMIPGATIQNHVICTYVFTDLVRFHRYCTSMNITAATQPIVVGISRQFFNPNINSLLARRVWVLVRVSGKVPLQYVP